MSALAVESNHGVVGWPHQALGECFCICRIETSAEQCPNPGLHSYRTDLTLDVTIRLYTLQSVPSLPMYVHHLFTKSWEMVERGVGNVGLVDTHGTHTQGGVLMF